MKLKRYLEAKGKDSKMAKSVNTPKDLDKAVKMFLKGVQKNINDHYKKEYSKLTPPILTAKKGKRYIKIIKNETFGSGKSVFCFIDAKEGPTFGDVLKAASWNAPARHSRGNVFDGSWGVNAVSVYSAHYMR